MKYPKPEYALNAYLMEKRLEAKLTQGEVAYRLGLSSPQYISNIERNLCKPSLETVNQLIGMYKLDKKHVIDLLITDYKNNVLASLGGKKRRKNA